MYELEDLLVALDDYRVWKKTYYDPYGDTDAALRGMNQASKEAAEAIRSLLDAYETEEA